MYKLEQKVYIKTVKRPGVIKDLTTDNFALVTYFINNARYTQLFNLDEIKPFRPNRKPLTIKIKYFDETLPKLEKIAIGDWVDLRAAEDVELKQFEYKLIKLGIAMELPKGYEANAVPRSSTFKNFGIIQTNHFGVIDESYKGDDDQWHFPALAMRDTVIKKGDRIAQFRINRKMSRVEFVEVKALGNMNRGGIGSTGTN